MAGAVVEVEKVWFAYNGQPALTGVDFRVEENDFVALVGPNGGGKTTLLKIILGLLRPDEGRVAIFGRPPAKVGRLLGYVPQEPLASRSFPITVEETVLLGRLGLGSGLGYSRADRLAAAQALEQVGLLNLRRRRIGHLSGGQRQRVFIARALAGQARLLLLDEPAASLDKEWRTRLFQLLHELNQDLTILLVSHDLSVISSHVKSVACLNQTLYHHPRPEITGPMLAAAYHCPVEVIGHGLPHRVLADHGRPAGPDDEEA